MPRDYIYLTKWVLYEYVHKFDSGEPLDLEP